MAHVALSRQDKTFWRKLAYSIFVVIVSIVLSHIPVYGIDSSTIQALFSSTSILSFSDLLTGGSLSQLAVGGFGVTSIIMAGIIIQLLSVLFPKIERIHSDGESGRIAYDRLTFILAMFFTILSGALAMISETAPYSGVNTWWGHCIPMVEWIIGSLTIILLCQGVYEHGIGNGPTLILAANIAQRIVPDFISCLYLEWQALAIVAVALVISIVLSVYLQAGTLNIRVQQTRKQLSLMNADGDIPMPVSMSSVLPIVYASSMMLIPSLYSTFTGHNGYIVTEILKFTNSSNWYSPSCWENVAGLAVYVLLIFLFSFYSASLGFSAAEIANQMRQRGDVIPGVRPGEETEVYITKRRRKLAFAGAIMLVFIAVLPDLVLTQIGLSSMSFMGTSLIILVAAFYDLRLRVKGMTKHWNYKYQLFAQPKTKRLHKVKSTRLNLKEA